MFKTNEEKYKINRDSRIEYINIHINKKKGSKFNREQQRI